MTGRTLAANPSAAALFAAKARCRASPSFGLPRRLPRAFAACRASLVRWAIISRSCCATAARMWIVSLLACGLSTATNSTPESIRVAMNARFRDRRSSFAITSLARCFLHAVKAAASWGRSLRLLTTMAVEALLDGEAETLTRKAIELAKAGDLAALRVCLDRIAPPRKDRPVLFELPPVTSAADAVQASGALVAAVAEGELTPSEAGELGKLVEAYIKALEATDFAERLDKLERMTNR